MKKILLVMFLVGICVSLVLSGCGQKKAVSSKEAIELAKTLNTAQEKAGYLIAQAKAFYNSAEFKETVKIVKYILRYVERDSQEARDLLQKAKDGLAAAAKQAAQEAGRNFSFGE